MKREQVKRELLKQELSFGLFMGRLKYAISVETDSAMALLLGMSTGNYANRKKTGSIPFEIAIPLAVSRSVNIDWLCRGVGDVLVDGKPVGPVPFVQVDSTLMGLVFFEIERAFAGDAPDARKTSAAARKLGILSALIYDKVVAEPDEKRRLEVIRSDAQLLARVDKRLDETPPSRKVVESEVTPRAQS